MSSNLPPVPTGGTAPVRRVSTETKASFKTTELIFYILAVAGVLIASWTVDVTEDGQVFSPYQAWFLVTLLTIGYMISRGLAKSGSREPYDDTADTADPSARSRTGR